MFFDLILPSWRKRVFLHDGGLVGLSCVQYTLSDHPLHNQKLISFMSALQLYCHLMTVCVYSQALPLPPSPPASTGVSTTIIIIVVVVVVVALIIFIIAVLIAIYCLCFRDSGKAGNWNSPRRRTFSFRSKHWTDSSGSHSMPRGDQQTRKDVSVITIGEVGAVAPYQSEPVCLLLSL